MIRFSGLLTTSPAANRPRRRNPNTSPDHSIGASGVLKATSADPWSASFMVETRTVSDRLRAPNFRS
ncbi:hypothetical protein RIF29_02562 [Crotalaria pallida]|uniref:Uncharacterized protein n=1 Tax=Crotalaria pallida TaxID=3830 RepID=A0AAN9DRV7_CROPI